MPESFPPAINVEINTSQYPIIPFARKKSSREPIEVGESSVDVLVRQIGTVVLSRSQERQLAIAKVNGDAAAREQLILRNARFALSAAYKKRDQNLEKEDRASEALIGLIKAVDRFDPHHHRKAKVITLAKAQISHDITRARDNTGSTIRIPVHLMESYRACLKYIPILTQELGRELTDQDLEKFIGLKPGEYRRIRESLTIASLDKPLGDSEESATLANVLLDDGEDIHEVVQAKDSSRILNNALNSLSNLERRIVVMNYGLGEEEPINIRSIAKRLKIHRDKVSQILALAKQKIRQFPEFQGYEQD